MPRPPQPQQPNTPGPAPRIRFSATPLLLLLALGLCVALLPAPSRADDPPAAPATAAVAPPPPAPNSTVACLECHNDPALTVRRNKTTVSLHLDPAVHARSVHSALDCTDCHDGFDGESLPHKKPLTPVDCASCHDRTEKTHAFHRHVTGPAAPTCATCHGTHDIAKLKSPASPFSPARQAAACGQCHATAQQHFLESAHGKTLAAGNADAPACLACHQSPVTPSDPGTPPPIALKLAQTELCQSCHLKKDSVSGQTLRGGNFIASFDQSVHGAALHAGHADAANCVDCHGAHEMNRAVSAGAKINKQNQAATCAKCHAETAAAYSDSVHAAALRKGNLDSPVCTDCHGEHAIRPHTDPAAPVNARNVARQVCATCHASLKLTQKYGLSSHAFQTFSDSYHGLAVRGGSVEVVNCASCHSVHAIRSHLDPASTVHKSNLVQTCGQCHPGANTRFTEGNVHVSTDASGPAADGNSAVIRLVANLYLWLIVVVIGGMALHNALDLFKKIRRKLAIQKGLIEEEHVAHRLYVRMTLHERLQHGVLVISFVLLVITGFMLRYPEAWWVVAIRNLSAGAFEWRGLVHRVAGVVMLAGGAWHIGYLAFTKPGRSLFLDLLPRQRDLTDPIHVLRYNLGLAPAKPEFPRFSYIEKSEYWALVWGTLLMGVTGAILWFDNTSMGLFTKLGFDISRTIHFYEAILATLAIIVWHFYFVLFNPDIYPMNLAWLTGRMSEKEMLEEHPLELKRLKALEAEAAKKSAARPDDPPAAPEAPPSSPSNPPPAPPAA